MWAKLNLFKLFQISDSTEGLDYIFCALISIFRAVILESLLSDQPWSTAAPTSMTCPCVFLHSLHALYITWAQCKAMIFIWGPWGPQHWTYWMSHLPDTPNSGQLISWWYYQVFSKKDTSKICSAEVLPRMRTTDKESQKSNIL